MRARIRASRAFEETDLAAACSRGLGMSIPVQVLGLPEEAPAEVEETDEDLLALFG